MPVPATQPKDAPARPDEKVPGRVFIFHPLLLAVYPMLDNRHYSSVPLSLYDLRDTTDTVRDNLEKP